MSGRLGFLHEPEPSRQSLADTVDSVVAELLAIIDMDQDFKGWAGRYRPHFTYQPQLFPTLGSALYHLRDLIAADRRARTCDLIS